MATYMIWEGFIEKLEKKLRTVENKCRKYGLEFTYRMTGNEEFRDVKDSEGEFHKLRYVEIEAEGKAQMNGWEWLASVERTEKGNLINSARDVEVPTKYYTSEPYCEHCQKNVWRKYLYLVRNTETGEIKQVGRGCLKDYTHGMSAEMIAFYQSLFTGLEEAEAEIPSGGMGFYGKVEYYDVEEVTRFMSETIRLFGFVPKGQDDKMSTAARAGNFYDVAHGRKHMFFPNYDLFYEIKAEMERIGFDANSPAAVKEAKEALAWIAEQDDSHSSYLHNLKVVCSMGQVRSWHYGILASLIPTWNKSLVREAARKAQENREKVSAHVGKVGERITFDVESTRIVTSWETDYGMMWLVKFVTTEGNVIMWRASNINALPDDLELVRRVIGTVKDHDEFRDIKQTFVNRCKVVEEGPKAEENHAPYNPEAEIALDEFLSSVS